MAKDHWTSDAYNASANFVPALTKKVVSYLDIRPTDQILDIGCGDGSLTSEIAAACAQGSVLGLDASKSFIKTATSKYSVPNCQFKHQDCTKLEECPEAIDGSFDKVFSNAAMHWILCDPTIRPKFFQNVNKALKPNGLFVFEMGGSGNVAEVQAAATAALIHSGLSPEESRQASPWFFPSTTWMEGTLEEAGFEVLKCEHEYRPTKLNPETEDKKGGLEGWVRLMCAEFLEKVKDEKKREEAVKFIVHVLEPIVTREEDGTRYLGYCRLRAVGRKK
jgi:trans-aconitate methyltransferase